MASLTNSLRASSRRTSIPLFLAPAFATAAPFARRASPPSSHFSTSATAHGSSATKKQEHIRQHQAGRPNWALQARPKLDRNKKRGVSAIRRTGPRSTRGLWKYPLPVPVARDYKGTSPEYAESVDHGLWGFFDASKQALIESDAELSHGRAWTYKELTYKAFDDLHKLYWVCVKEQNRALTRKKEHSRLEAGYGEAENEERVTEVRKTMETIRIVLVHRQLSYLKARGLISEKYVRDMLETPSEDPLEADNEFVTSLEETQQPQQQADLPTNVR